MATVIFIQNGKPTEVKIHDGHTVLRAAKQGRVALRHKCGGNASCTTCKVKIVDQDGVSKPNRKEEMRLGEENIAQGFRLSCQTRVHGKAQAEIPEDPYKARIRQLLAQQKEGLD